jgi:PAS domain S-box-containing protein
LPASAKHLFRYLFEQASLGIAVEDIEGRLLLANPALCSMLGYTEEELCNMSCSEFANPEDSGDDWALFQQLRSGMIDHYSLEKRYRRKDGALRWGRLNVSLLKDDEGSHVVFALVEDITEGKLTREALQKSEERLRLAAQAGKVYAYEWDPASDLVTRSEEHANILGRPDPPQRLTRQQLAARVHPDDRAGFISSVDDLTPEHPTTQLSYRMLRPDGSVVWLEKNGRAFFDEQGRLLRVLGMVADITERKRTEERLREYEKAVEGCEEMIAVVDREYRYLIANRKFLKLRNLTKKQVVGRLVSEILNKGIFEEVVKEKLDECFAGKVVKFEMRYTYPKLGERDLFVSYFPIEGSDGVDRAVCILQDITERKWVEEALKKSEEKFSKAFQQSPMAFTLTSARDHRYIDVNETFERITGWRRDEVIGRTPFDIGLWADPAERTDIATRILTERSIRNMEFRFRMRDGSVRVGFSSAELIELDGEPCILGVSADVTDLKRSQEALRESEARERARVKELEAILDAVPVPVLIAYNVDCHWITGNRAASEQLRVARGQNLSLSAPPSERPTFWQMQDGVEIPADMLPMQEAAATGNPVYGRELTLVFEDGTRREEIANAVPLLDEAGKPRGAVAASIDVTALKRTEGALRESEDKLRLLLDSTAEAIYGIDLEHRCTFCNPACLRTLGYESVDEVLGKNMHNLIHHTRADGRPFPEDECRVHLVTRTGEGAHAEDEVLWRANRTSFPAEYWSYPQRRGHEVVGAVVAFIDITDRKLAEAALANVSRKLIEAQDQERSRIGRELHDDIGQRLALLAVELQQLRHKSVTLPQVRRRVSKLQKRTSEIAADVQSLSHELHSAKLQYLGITAAVRGFCREFAEKQKVEIDFKSHDMPIPLSADVSLCLFRVLQEALHNSAKHSGVRHFEVRLWGTADEIHLTVRDSGTGFDLEAARTSQGLGLISMEERLKALNGTLSVESFLKRGTTIHARIPLRSAGDSMCAAG